MSVEASDNFGDEAQYNDGKYNLQTSVLAELVGVSEAELLNIPPEDPRNAKLIALSSDTYAVKLSDAIKNTPKEERDQLFDLVMTDREAAAKRFLAAHPELRSEGETLH